MGTIAVIGLIAGGLAGLMGGIANMREENAANDAAAATAAADAAFLTEQDVAADDLFAAQQAERQAQLDAANQQALFDIETTAIEGERAVGSQIAANAASGLTGASKTSVADQVRSDYDRMIGQMQTQRAEMVRAGLVDQQLAKQQYTSDNAARERDIGLLTAESEALAEQGSWDTASYEEQQRDVWSVLTGLMSGLA